MAGPAVRLRQVVVVVSSRLGEDPDGDEYRAAMVADRRLVVRPTPERADGMWSVRS